MSNTQSDLRPGSDHNPIFGIEILRSLSFHMQFVNRFFINSNLNSNSKVGGQFHSVIGHLTIHLFDHNHFMLQGPQFSVLSSWLLSLEFQIILNTLSYCV